jgi:hypothetical protein
LTSGGLYASGTQSGFVHSTDGGATWSEIDGWSGSTAVGSLAVDRLSTSKPIYVLQAAATPVAWQSTNAGKSWTKLSLPVPTGELIYSLAVDPTTAGRVYAFLTPDYTIAKNTATANQFLLSTNGGKSWTKESIGGATDGFIAVGPTGPFAFNAKLAGTIYAGMATGLWKSTNGGTQWSQVTTLTAQPVFTALVAADQTASIYVGSYSSTTGTTLNKSTDGGNTWTAVTQPFGSINVGCTGFSCTYYALASATPSNSLFAYPAYPPLPSTGGNPTEIDVSTTQASSWSSITAPLSAVVDDIIAVSVGTSNLYIGADTAAYAAPITSLLGSAQNIRRDTVHKQFRWEP